MEYEKLIVTQKQGTGWITINRPEALNALNSQMLHELETALEGFEKDKSVKVIIITGEGKAFIAGADIAEMKEMNSVEARAFSHMGQRVFSKIETIEKPVIAAINGFALGGGCELAMACDIRIASDKAKLGQPETGLGVIPGFGGTQRLSCLCGVAVAKELIFSGMILDAQSAEKKGLVNRVVPAEKLIEEVTSLADKIIQNSPLAVSLAKTVINKGIDSSLQTGCSYEAEVFGLCFSSSQQKEGMRAFLEKRKPQWSE